MPSQPITMPVAEWTPDLPPLGPGSSNIKNVIARTPMSYGPFQGLAIFSNALSKRCQGAAAFLDINGNVNGFAGDANDLYHIASGSTSWTNVSKSAGAYSCAADAMWTFLQFGTTVIALNGTDTPQAWTLGSSSAFADLSGSPPVGKYGAVISNFLMIADTTDTTNGPQQVHWSAVNDPTNWPTLGTSTAAQYQSDANYFYGNGGWIQGVVGELGTANGAIFMEHAVYRVMYAGPPNVFNFYPAEGVVGTPSPYSIVQRGALVYFLGEDGFYAFDGTTSQPIGANKIDKTFFADVDTANMHRVVGAVDPINKLIIWAYPGSGNTNGNPNHLLLYNWQLDRWTIADVTVETIMRLLTFGYTLDQLGTTLGYTLDNLPFSLDSRVWEGGTLVLGAFDTNHKLNFFNGTTLAATVETQEVQPTAGRRTLIRNARALVDGGTSSVSIGYRNRLVDTRAYTNAVAMNSLGTCPQRVSGRYLTAQITLPAAAAFTHINGLEIEGVAQGFR